MVNIHTLTYIYIYISNIFIEELFIIIMYKFAIFALVGIFLSGSSVVLFLRYLKRKKNLKPKSMFVIKNNHQWNSCLHIIEKELSILPALGFDCEWKTIKGKANQVSLLQLATNSGICFLIRLNLMEGQFPSTLLDILSDRKIIKFGVGCVDDSNKLLRDHNISCLGCVDLRNFMLRNNLDISSGGGLKSLSQNVLNVDLDKSVYLRCSNWEAVELSDAQILYAACDALAAILIFISIYKKKFKNMEYTPEKFHSLFQGILDLNYKISHKENNTYLKPMMSDNFVPNELKINRAYTVRKSPLYQNCKLFAADGQLLCTCDNKKANWYLDKGLAELMCEDPLSVRLLFEPAGRPEDEEDYYVQEKMNICVVCGKDDSYIRKNIVPHEYRKHFPALMKEHKSHDIVLLCTTCHMRSNHQDNALRQRLSHECHVPLNQALYSEDQDLVKIKSAAKALNHRSYRIPDDRKLELQSLVCEYFGVSLSDLSSELLTKASQIETKKLNNEYIEHGEVVVKRYMESQGLIAFERMWRQHFLDCMQPKCMPFLWSVDHRHKLLQE